MNSELGVEEKRRIDVFFLCFSVAIGDLSWLFHTRFRKIYSAKFTSSSESLASKTMISRIISSKFVLFQVSCAFQGHFSGVAFCITGQLKKQTASNFRHLTADCFSLTYDVMYHQTNQPATQPISSL